MSPADTSSAPAASDPTSVPAVADRTADQVAPAVVRPSVSMPSSTQNPCDRSSDPATSRASARPVAVRTAFWKTTERGVRWPAIRTHHSRGVDAPAYQNCSSGSPGIDRRRPVARDTAALTVTADTAAASSVDCRRSSGCGSSRRSGGRLVRPRTA